MLSKIRLRTSLILIGHAAVVMAAVRWSVPEIHVLSIFDTIAVTALVGISVAWWRGWQLWIGGVAGGAIGGYLTSLAQWVYCNLIHFDSRAVINRAGIISCLYCDTIAGIAIGSALALIVWPVYRVATIFQKGSGNGVSAAWVQGPIAEADCEGPSRDQGDCTISYDPNRTCSR